MTPEEQATVDRKLKEVAEISYNNTSKEELNTFETIELSVRDHLPKTVAPKIGDFFFHSAAGTSAGRERRVKSCADADASQSSYDDLRVSAASNSYLK